MSVAFSKQSWIQEYISMRSAPTKVKIKNHGAISTRKIKLIYHLKRQVKILLSKSLCNFTPPPAMSLRMIYLKFKTIGNC